MLREIAIYEQHGIIAEGAGAASLAAAQNLPPSEKKIVSIISGGNIDEHKLNQILNNEIPH